MTAPSPLLLRGDARNLPLCGESVDLIVTSPPYFGLRSYTDGGEHYEAQLGSEASPRAFLDALIECTAEMMRVLKPSGSIWLNLGDKYSGAQAQNFGGSSRAGDSAKVWAQTNPKNTGIPNKSLMLLPHRYAIRAVDELGLICRQDQVWAKANGLPESVQDRTRRAHEYFFHLTKQPRYYSAVDEIRERTEGRAGQMTWEQRKARGDGMRQGEQRGTFGGGGMAENPLGKLPGSVWEIPTQPLNVPKHLGIDHFAAFPMEWPRRIIQGWSPREVCNACGEGRRPVASSFRTGAEAFRPPRNTDRTKAGHHGMGSSTLGPRGVMAAISGYACACPDTSAPSRQGVVLDPFSGTGTTALVATMLGRRGIGVDLSADYCRLAQWRANDPKERARAAGLDPDAVAAIKPELAGQIDLFGGEAA